MTIIGAFTAHLCNELLDHVLQLGSGDYTPPTIYVALVRGDGSEPAGADNYARVAAASWNAAAGRQVANTNDIVFPAAGGSGWGTITGWEIYDDPSAGNKLAEGDLTASKSVAAGNTVSFAAGELVIHFNRWEVAYTNGTTQLAEGATITGATSGATATVVAFNVASGSQAGGDAAGRLWIEDIGGGPFQAETVNVSGSPAADIDGALVAGVSDYLAHKFLDLVFSGTGFSVTATDLGASTSLPGSDGSNITRPGNNYADAAVTAWDAAADGVSANTSQVSFPTPSGPWGTLKYWITEDGSGNLLWYGRMDPQQAPDDGDTFRAPAGDLVIALGALFTP